MEGSRSERREYRIHQLFEIGIVLKGANATLEILFGIVLLFTRQIGNLIITFAQNELIDDPNDFFAVHIDKYSHYLTPQFQLYGALYLLSHGVVKILLVWGLLKNKLWSYPASLAVLVLFIAYQVIKYLETHSIFLVILTVFDLIVLWLIWHEYRLVSKSMRERGAV